MPEITSRLSTALADRYKIERHLSEGGMATLYLANEASLNRQVVIRLLPREMTSEVSAARRIPSRHR